MAQSRVYKDCDPYRLRPDYDPHKVGQVQMRDYSDLARCVSLVEEGDVLIFNRGTLWYKAVRVQKITSGSKQTLELSTGRSRRSKEVVHVRVHWKYMGRITNEDYIQKG